MKYAMVAAFAAGAMAGYYPGMEAPSNGTDTYVTEVVTKLETYCPGPTKITHGGSTYTVTEATTLTITNCPCTVTYPVTTSTTSVCSTCSAETSAAPVYSSSSEVSTSAAPVYTTSAPAPVTPPVSGVPTSYAANSTIPVYSSPSASTSAGAQATFTGAANHVAGQAGAGLAALLGFAAYVL